MSLEKSARDLRWTARLLELLADRIEPEPPDALDIANAKHAAESNVPCWWQDGSLASIGIVECRTFGRGRHVREWLD